MQLATVVSFLRASISGAQLSVVRLVVGFLRVKYVALTFGTAGTGLLAQATQLSILGVSGGSLAMAVGIINGYTSAEAAKDPENRRRLLATAFTVQLILCAMILLVGVLAADKISFLVFGPGQGKTKVIAVFIGIPFSVLASCYFEGILFGANHYDFYIRGSIIAAIIGLSAFFPLTYFWGLNGAFLALVAGSLALFACFLYYVSKILPFRDVFRLGIDRAILPRLFSFSVVMLLVSVATYLSNILLRRLVLGKFGVGSTGIMQVPLALTAYYTPFLTNAMWGRLHPTVSKHGDSVAGRAELNPVLIITVALNTAAILALLILQEFFVRLAYSPAFLPALPLIPLQLIGDYFYFIAFTFSVYFLGAARLRVYLVGWLSYFAVQISATLSLLPMLELKAIPIGYLIANVLFALPGIVWLLQRLSGVERVKTFSVLAGCLLVVLAQAAITIYSPQILWRVPVALLFFSLVLVAYRSRSRWLVPTLA